MEAADDDDDDGGSDGEHAHALGEFFRLCGTFRAGSG
jgi:hypothetical protein